MWLTLNLADVSLSSSLGRRPLVPSDHRLMKPSAPEPAYPSESSRGVSSDLAMPSSLVFAETVLLLQPRLQCQADCR